VSREYLLDASALLAIIFQERGGIVVEGLIAKAAIHTFTIAEVVTTILRQGIPDPEALIAGLEIEIMPNLSLDEAVKAAQMHSATRSHGLSMGDCLCLSMAESKGWTAVTADRVWPDAMKGWGIQVLCIR
jgi:ribonuclease VapC